MSNLPSQSLVISSWSIKVNLIVTWKDKMEKKKRNWFEKKNIKDIKLIFSSLQLAYVCVS